MIMAAPHDAPHPKPPAPDILPAANGTHPSGLRWGLLAGAGLLFTLSLAGLNQQGTRLSEAVPQVLPAMMARPPSHRLPVFTRAGAASANGRATMSIPAPPPPGIPPPARIPIVRLPAATIPPPPPPGIPPPARIPIVRLPVATIPAPAKTHGPRRPSSGVALLPPATRPAPAVIPAPPRPTMPKEALQTGPVLHLRDTVPGLAWLGASAPPLRLSGIQRHRLQALLPRIRKNFEGPHGAFDEALEQQVDHLLTAPQSKAMRDWLLRQNPRPDCIEGLRSLARLCGAKPKDDKRAIPAH